MKFLIDKKANVVAIWLKSGVVIWWDKITIQRQRQQRTCKNVDVYETIDDGAILVGEF